jgi:hypothetical protein
MRTRFLPALVSAVIVASCASHETVMPPNATLGVRARGAPVVKTDGNPEIVAMAFNKLDLRRGEAWSGDFVTSTNAASLEVRTNLFSINVPRTSFGRFHFEEDILDVPSIFVRGYPLRVIARNAQGAEAEEDVPLRIR